VTRSAVPTAGSSAPSVRPDRGDLPVSVCIPVRNEEDNLPECLESLSAFSEILLVDSQSSDSTHEIAQRAGISVIQFKWNGSFPKKRNWTLRNYRFQNPWVLFLDADERATPTFVTELREVLPRTSHVGFWLLFTNRFTGRDLRFGDRLRKLALFRIGAGEYERFPEDSWSVLDMEVHEHPILIGTIGQIRSRLRHHDRRSLAVYLSRHDDYSTWEARRYQWLHGGHDKQWQMLNARQRFKYRNLCSPWLPYFYFVFQYVIKWGFLDGPAGLRFALLKLRYFKDIRRKIRAFGP
jgi:glycosyltransferase involved in cell wall biosynthesis